MRDVFSEELVQYSNGHALRPVVENLVNKVEKLEQIIPNANLTFFSDLTVRSQYGDFSKPNNYLSTFVAPITDLVCSLSFYSLARGTRAFSLNAARDTEGYIDKLVTLYAELTFGVVERRIILKENLVTFWATFKKPRLIKVADTHALALDSTFFSSLADKHTYLWYKNIFFHPKLNLFTLSNLRASSPHFVSDFCKKNLFLLAKQILLTELKRVDLINGAPRAINALDESFGVIVAKKILIPELNRVNPSSRDLLAPNLLDQLFRDIINRLAKKSFNTIPILLEKSLADSFDERFAAIYNLLGYRKSQQEVETHSLVRGIHNLEKEIAEREGKGGERIKLLTEICEQLY